MIATLIGGLLQWLKRRMIWTSRGGGHWSPDDFDVRLGDAGGKVIGASFARRSRRRIGLGSGRSLSASRSGRRRGVTLRRERMRWRISRPRGSASRDPQIRNLQWPLRCPGLRTPNILSTPPQLRMFFSVWNLLRPLAAFSANTSHRCPLISGFVPAQHTGRMGLSHGAHCERYLRL
jgi:hypothetical protein